MTTAAGPVHVIVPATVHDAERPSGGNVYDRRVCAELVALGRAVVEHPVRGSWPCPTAADEARLAAVLEGLPRGADVLVDGLVASATPGLVVQHTDRLRLVVLVHLPIGVDAVERRAAEGAMLRQVSAVVTTSAWTRSWLAAYEDVHPDRVTEAVPGADPAPVATGTPTGSHLLCVGAVTPTKGYDVLLDALAGVGALAWHCTVVGSLDVDRAFARRLLDRADPERFTLRGPLQGADLDAAYRDGDVLVLASRAETYGMVLTEALARGLPVVATRTGGVREALADGALPELLVPPGDACALTTALRTWLTDPAVRTRARAAALRRRDSLPRWAETARLVDTALGRGPADPQPVDRHGEPFPACRP